MLTVTGLEKGLRFSSESQFQDACRAIRKEKALLPLEMLADDFHIIQERDKANPEESCAKRARYSNKHPKRDIKKSINFLDIQRLKNICWQ